MLAVGRYGLEIAFDSQSSLTGRRIYSVTIDGSSSRPITKTMRYVGDSIGEALALRALQRVPGERATGLEPATSSLEGWRSTN